MNKMKISEISMNIDRIMRILQGFMIAFALVSLIFIVLAFTVGEKIIQDASCIKLGNISLYISNSAIPEYSTLRSVIVFDLVMIFFMVSTGWYILHVIRHIMKPMKEGRPFENGIAEKVRKLAWATLIGGAIIESCNMFGIAAEIKAYDLSMLLNAETVLKYSYNYSINLFFVVIAGIISLLSLCFKYGESLQTEFDETL